MLLMIKILLWKNRKFGLISDMRSLRGLRKEIVILDPQPTHKDGVKVKVFDNK